MQRSHDRSELAESTRWLDGETTAHNLRANRLWHQHAVEVAAGPGVRNATERTSRTVSNAEPGRIEVHVRDLNQFFHSFDPAPFYDRDLDDDAEELIVSAAKQLDRKSSPSLVVYLSDASGIANATRVVADAIRVHFARRAEQARRDLRELFRIGRISLAIGLPILVASLLGGELLAETAQGRPLVEIFRQSLLIGGWVAMWRPMEIFLYDWWPIRDQRRMHERLSRMDVRVTAARAS